MQERGASGSEDSAGQRTKSKYHQGDGDEQQERNDRTNEEGNSKVESDASMANWVTQEATVVVSLW